jgi:hypothetical protein
LFDADIICSVPFFIISPGKIKAVLGFVLAIGIEEKQETYSSGEKLFMI